eukprot:5711662-Pleurochrysis_carterae.AAC.6
MPIRKQSAVQCEQSPRAGFRSMCSGACCFACLKFYESRTDSARVQQERARTRKEQLEKTLQSATLAEVELGPWPTHWSQPRHSGRAAGGGVPS